jgi:hypothetical protein
VYVVSRIAVVVVRFGGGRIGDQLKAVNFKITLDALLNRYSCLNLLAPKFYFAYSVYKMQKYRTEKR